MSEIKLDFRKYHRLYPNIPVAPSGSEFFLWTVYLSALHNKGYMQSLDDTELEIFNRELDKKMARHKFIVKDGNNYVYRKRDNKTACYGCGFKTAFFVLFRNIQLVAISDYYKQLYSITDPVNLHYCTCSPACTTYIQNKAEVALTLKLAERTS